MSKNPRLFLLFLIFLTSIFLLSQLFFRTPSYNFNLAAWPSTPTLAPTQQNKTQDNVNIFGIASRIYVISLPGRADRRNDMELIRETLGLRWTYMQAMDAKNPIVDSILHSVQSTRESTETDPFIWPEHIPPPDAYIEPWSPGFLSSTPGSDTPSPPLMCATQNNTLKPYDPAVPQFSILTPARIACWYSHLSIIQTIANDNDLQPSETVIVLEDDVDMERNIHQRLLHLWPFLPPDWDMVYLGHCWSNETFNPALNAHADQDEDPTRNHSRTSSIHPSKSPLCTHAYALSRSGARRLLLHLRYPPFAFSRAIDMAFSWLIQSNRIKSFSIVPSIVVQRKVGNSDIMSGKGSTWRDELVHGVFERVPVGER